jgi:hypothetical protein
MTQTPETVETILIELAQAICRETRSPQAEFMGPLLHPILARAKERLAALFPAQPPSLTFSDDRATKLADHWLYEMKCDHDAKTDVACCSCGWVSEAKASVGEAAKVWASHALSTLEPK